MITAKESGDFRELTKLVLNALYRINLEEDVVWLDEKGVRNIFDLADLKNNFYVEFKQGGGPPDYKENLLSLFQNWVKLSENKTGKFQFHVVFEDYLNDKDREFYRRNVQSVENSVFDVYDITKIEQHARRLKISLPRIDNDNEIQNKSDSNKKIQLSDKEIIWDTIIRVRDEKQHLDLSTIEHWKNLDNDSWRRIKDKLLKPPLITDAPYNKWHIYAAPKSLLAEEDDFDEDGNYLENKKNQKENKTNDGINILETFLKNKQRGFFAVGHLWNENKEDQMGRFIEKGIWENGYEENNVKTVNSVKEGDVLYLKSSFSGTLRVKAIGLVTGNPKDGHLLSVNWHLINQIDLPKLGAYRDTITKIGHENVRRILEGLYNQLPEVVEIIERLDRLISPKPIVLDIKPFSEKNIELVRDTEFYFQKAVDVLEVLKTYDDINDGFVDLKEIKRAVSAESSSFIQLNTHWKNRGDTTPKEFITYLKKHQSDLIPLYELISKFISYIDGNAWNKNEYNEYSDNRVIAKTGVNQTDLVTHFLDFALNGFEIEPKREGFVFSNAIEYLRNPSEKFNILSKKHIALISKYFLGAIYSGDEFHSKLKNYFEQEYQLSVVNLKNLTCFYTIIIYDPSIRKLWETNGTGTGFGGGLPPIIGDNNDGKDEDDNESHDKIPFHHDNVEIIDRLNREPVAKSLARLINSEIFPENGGNHSFMIHLQGEWGIGKSTFLNLIKNHLNTKDRKWNIIEYNAWQNQHISPPWWSFIDHIYRKGKLNIKRDEKCRVWFNENCRRIIWYSGWNKIASFLMSVIFLIVVVLFRHKILNLFSSFGKNEEITLSLFFGSIVSIGSVIGLIYSFSKFISTPLLLRSSEGAISFMKRATDPMNRIKKHFNGLITNINDEGYEVAVFIDDIDRCNKKFAVELLEGIQTLFKDKRVLYIVAGDKNWITTCFEVEYKDFIGKVSKKGDELGNLFLEKAFQLSVRIPKISDNTKKKYWQHILGVEDDNTSNEKIEKLSDEIKIQLKQRLGREYRKGNFSNSKVLSDIEAEYKQSEEVITDLAIEVMDKNDKEVKHLFIEYSSLIDPNPRSIKRLANTYTMSRNTLVAERKMFNPSKLFRWLVIEDLYPKIATEIIYKSSANLSDVELKKLIDGNQDIENLKLLLLDVWGMHGGPLKINEVFIFIGK